MTLLIAGLLIFLFAHVGPSIPGVKRRLVDRLGEGRYRGLYIATSVIGMIGVIAGITTAEFVYVWNPPAWGRTVAAVLMAVACVVFVALFIPCHIRRLTPHPMLWGITLWSIAHLLANGDGASMILFGGFGAYSLYAIWSLDRRGASVSAANYAVSNDIFAVGAGVAAYAALIWIHPYLTGVPAVG